MCRIYEFPTKKELPHELAERLDKLAKNYVQLMNEFMQYFEDNYTTNEEIEELMEMIILSYAESITKAVDDL